LDTNKYAIARSSERPHGYPAGTSWDEIVAYLSPRGHFLWFREIEKDLPKRFVRVRGCGDMLMLGGYSYLGLNGHPEIRAACNEALDRYGTGSHGSRWLAGHTTLHAELEELIADTHGTQDAIVYTSGYVANVSTLSALLSRKDTVFSDKMNHASLSDGCWYSGAKFKRFRHNDPEDLRQALSEKGPSGRRMVFIDGVFSMSGDVCSAPEFVKVCEQYDAALFVDECHSHFVLGQSGGGIKEFFGLRTTDVDVEMGTLSKVIPSAGGYIAGSMDMVTFLRRASRGFIYSGATPAVMIAAAIAALHVFRREREVLISNLSENIKFFRDALAENGMKLVGGGETPIVPILVGPAVAAARAATYCQKGNIFIHPVFPPVVESGRSIMRASVMATHRTADLQYAADVIAESILRAMEDTSEEEAALM